VTQGWAATARSPKENFFSVAHSFLERLGRLEHDPAPPPGRYDAWLEDFLQAECRERGLALATRKKRQWHIRHFLTYLDRNGYSLESLTPDQIDSYFKHLGQTWSRVSLSSTDAAVLAALRPGAKISEGIREHWWLQGMMGGVKAHYDCIKAFSETDLTEDLKKIDIPALVMHGDDDQIVPIGAAGLMSAKILKKATLKVYPGFPYGIPATNADLLAFFMGATAQASAQLPDVRDFALCAKPQPFNEH
jgi:pimeloyl-ACP methyl ester carboxylesterase